MDYIAHRSHKYIKRVMGKNGKWRYYYNTTSSKSKNGYTDEYRTDKVSRERYPWRYTTYAVPADSNNAENSRNRRIAARASTEDRRKEQMAERKTNKNTEKFLNTLYKMPLGGLLKLYVERVKKKK